MAFRVIKKSSVSEAIVQQVKTSVLKGELSGGDKLPSEREMAEQMGVGRSSVREATSALIALGVVEIRPGEGVYVRDDFPRSTLESVEWSSLLVAGHADDLSEARLVIEVNTARMAASRATQEERDQLHAIVNRMASAKNLNDFIALDLEFHLTLANASKNVVLREVIAGIQQLMHECMFDVLQSEDLRVLAVAQHRQLCQALDRASEALAEAVMKKHLQKDIDFFQNAGGCQEDEIKEK